MIERRIVLLTVLIISLVLMGSGCKSKKETIKGSGAKEMEDKNEDREEKAHEKQLSAIAAQVPTSLSRLEEIIGKVNRKAGKDEIWELARANFSGEISSVDIKFSIDIHHQDPFKVKDPRIKNYSLTFNRGLEYCLEILQEEFGKAKVLQHENKQVHRFDTGTSSHPRYISGFYVFPGKGDAFRLSWYSEVPDFAVTERTAEETASLEDKLVKLLTGSVSRKNIELIFGKFEEDKDWGTEKVSTETWTFEIEPPGEETPERFVFSVEPPLPGNALVKALGVKDPIIVSTTVHMTNRVVADLETRKFPEASGYMLHVNVKDENLEKTDINWPASAVWRSEQIKITSIEGFQSEK